MALLAAARPEGHGPGEGGHPDDLRLVVARARHPGADPLGEDAVFERVGGEADAPAVLDGAGRLQEHQALGR